MIKWEYKVVETTYKSYDNIVTNLNEVGEEGWEVINERVNDIVGTTTYLFKRRKRVETRWPMSKDFLEKERPTISNEDLTQALKEYGETPEGKAWVKSLNLPERLPETFGEKEFNFNEVAYSSVDTGPSIDRPGFYLYIDGRGPIPLACTEEQAANGAQAYPDWLVFTSEEKL